MIEDVGLVLEGGGMRGLYTAGVLDFFIDKDIYFRNCIGVSAGACHAASYYCKQRGRAFHVSVDYLGDKNYCSAYSLLKTGNLFNVEMVYGTIPQKLYPLDNATFKNLDVNFYSVVTNCRTGKAEYLKIKDVYKDLDIVRASASLPLMAHKVKIKGEKYLDGGVSDSIPIKKSVELGLNKNVVILTQPRDYQKSPNSLYGAMKIKYFKYKELLKSIKNRHLVYNGTLKYIFEQEKQGNIFVIAPEKDLGVGRIEKDSKKLQEIYEQGYKDGEKYFSPLMEFTEN